MRARITKFIQPVLPPILRNREFYLKFLSGSGIEIGALHRPVYAPHLAVQYVDRLSKEQLLKEYPELKGLDIVEADILDDAESLETIKDSSQDFVIANHVIEHMVDPIKSLLAWQRVLRPGGRLYLAVPDKRKTFDQERELTSIDHLLDDFQNPSKERDFIHFQDFASKVSCKVFGLRPIDEAEELARELYESNYSIHYHVWTEHSFREFLKTVQKEIAEWQCKELAFRPTKRDEFILVLEKRG